MAHDHYEKEYNYDYDGLGSNDIETELVLHEGDVFRVKPAMRTTLEGKDETVTYRNDEGVFIFLAYDREEEEMTVVDSEGRRALWQVTPYALIHIITKI